MAATEIGLGILKLRVVRGVDLEARDFFGFGGSDPYVIVRLGKQQVQTDAIKHNVNPEWNEELSLIVEDLTHLIRLKVMDENFFKDDDPLGNAEFEIKHLVQATKSHHHVQADGMVIKKVPATRKNSLAEESHIMWSKGKVVQNLVVRLRNCQKGEIELELEFDDFAGSSSSH